MDNFENGYFWEYYMDLERQFIDFQNYVPYLEGNENVYSFRLLNLFLSIGSHVDSAFKEIFRSTDFSRKYSEIYEKIIASKASIKDYRILESEFCLSDRPVIFKRLPEQEILFPFKEFKQKSPEWWKNYNDIKHEFSVNFTKANFKNVRDALAGAFLINLVHKPAILRLYEYGIAKNKYHEVIAKYADGDYLVKPDLEVMQNILKDTIYPPLRIETALFIFDFEKEIDPQFK